MNTPKLILDTDPGLDDAIAITVLAAFAKERVDTILSSYGNISLEQTTQNVLKMCRLTGISPFLIQGSAHPVDADTFEDASHIHGADGLGNVTLLPAELPIVTERPLEVLYERILELGTVDYIALGPLTNLAQLLKCHPDVQQHLNRIIMMGAGFGRGNVTPHAEFNIYCDPQSAAQVFACGVQQTLIPLNTTHQVSLSMAEIDRICSAKTDKADVLRQILATNYTTNTAQGDDGCVVHDATAVIYYLFPALFTVQAGSVQVLTQGEQKGKTNFTPCAASFLTATTQVDKESVMAVLQQAIESSESKGF